VIAISRGGGLITAQNVTGKPVEVRTVLDVTQPAGPKIEKQVDMNLSILRGYVEAIGAGLNLSCACFHTLKLISRTLEISSPRAILRTKVKTHEKTTCAFSCETHIY